MADEAERTEATKREGLGERVQTPVPAATAHPQLERGAAVGRYVVLDVLGEGGMGVVYGAYDPELDRKVAIKLLQGSAADGTNASGDQGWLQREAQAMARLSHPNVIAVHDVGMLPPDRVFVAMELVEGATLRAWLKAKPRSWREIVPVMCAAGAGLAAAHAAGLVHRDFKPDNVLVGNDGRVRVMDFGLARLKRESGDAEPEPSGGEGRASDPDLSSRGPLSESFTRMGVVVGTPAYMAPELYAGKGADARTDQFAFGVALYEALFRTRPFDKKTLAASATTPPVPRPIPAEPAVPARLAQIVLRAIAADPAARYASMDALLGELAVDPNRARKRIALGATAVVLLAGAAFGTYALSHAASAPCKGLESRFAGVWDGGVRQAAQQAFAASKLGFAARAFDSVAKQVDSYSHDWLATAVESCEATRVHGTQSEEVLDLRQDCLDQRLRELRAFTQLLVKADASDVDKLAGGVEKLEPLARCSNVAELRTATIATPAMREKLPAIYDDLSVAKAGLLAGKFGAVLNAGQRALDAAKAIGFDPVIAEAEVALGYAQIQLGNGQDALTGFSEGVWAGMRSRRDDVVAMASLSSAVIEAQTLNQQEAAKVWLGIAASASARWPDKSIEIWRLQAAGIVAGQTGDLVTATQLHQQAFDLAIQTNAPDSFNVLHVEQTLAATLARAGSWAKAVPHFEHALRFLSASLGDDHVELAPILSDLGAAYMHFGQPDKGRAALARALAIREKALGPDSPYLATTLNNMADLENRTGDPAAAMVHIERARLLAAKVPGRKNPAYHTIATTEGEILMNMGKLDEARAWFDELIKLEDSVNSPETSTTLVSRGDLAMKMTAPADAAGFYARAIALYEATGGKDEPELWQPLTGLGRAKLALGHPDEAKPVLERALALAAKVAVPEADLAPTREALAKAGAAPAPK